MERVRIAVSVPVKHAVIGGQTEFGDTEVYPTEDQLSALTRDEDRVLGGFMVMEGRAEQKRLRIREAPASWDGVVEAVQRITRSREQADRKAVDSVQLMRERREKAPAVASVLRKVFECDSVASDMEVIENALPAIIEDARQRLEALGVHSDRMRILSVQEEEWRRMSVKERETFSAEADAFRKKAEEAMQGAVPAAEDGLLRGEVLVARIRERSRLDGVARRPVTYVVVMVHCAAYPSLALLVRADNEGR